MKSQNVDTPRIFVPPPLLHAVALVGGLALDGRWSGDELLTGELRWLAIGLLVIGLAFIATALGWFWKIGTRAEPWAPAQRLVTTGIYRWTRNPMYVGMALTYLGVALLFRSAAAAAFLVPVLAIMNFIIIPREEAYLTRRFGLEYDAFRGRVRRWL